MKILLPPTPLGERRPLPEGIRNLTIIGANGAGKTRFAKYLAAGLGEKAFRLSALQAIYRASQPQDEPGTLDALYLAAAKSPSFLSSNSATPFERLFALLLNDEIGALVQYKMARI